MVELPWAKGYIVVEEAKDGKSDSGFIILIEFGYSRTGKEGHALGKEAACR